MKKNLSYFRKKLTEAGIEVKPNFEGINTFLGTKYKQDLASIDIALVGVPFDIATSAIPGSRLAPQAVRNIGSMPGIYSRENGIFPYEKLMVADIGDVSLPNRFSVDGSHKDIQKFFSKIKKNGIIPITIGGDHSITLPILRALAGEEPVSLIHFDAHCDTEEGYGGTKFPHGSVALNAASENLIRPDKSVQIGIRDGWDMFWDEKLKSQMKIINMDMMYDLKIEEIINSIRETVGNNKVYITFDVDCLDPAYAPGTGSPEVGGLTSYQARRIIREMKGLNIIGADVVEICPPLDSTNQTSLVGATMMFEMLCIISEGKGKK